MSDFDELLETLMWPPEAQAVPPGPWLDRRALNLAQEVFPRDSVLDVRGCWHGAIYSESMHRFPSQNEILVTSLDRAVRVAMEAVRRLE